MVGNTESGSGSDSGDVDGAWACPVPMAHDRFWEADYFRHQMEENYHEPRLFRYNLNAFLAALKAVYEVLGKELAAADHLDWWKERSALLRQDPVLSKFSSGRNIALHQRSLLEGSRVAFGLFRGRRQKLTPITDIRSDEPSKTILLRVVPDFVGFILDEDHSAIAEQVGIQRLYFVPELSEDEDVVRAARRALARITGVLVDAHSRFGAEQMPINEQDVLDSREIDAITVLLETDIDPDAARRWGWEGDGDEAAEPDGGE